MLPASAVAAVSSAVAATVRRSGPASKQSDWQAADPGTVDTDGLPRGIPYPSWAWAGASCALRFGEITVLPPSHRENRLIRNSQAKPAVQRPAADVMAAAALARGTRPCRRPPGLRSIDRLALCSIHS